MASHGAKSQVRSYYLSIKHLHWARVLAPLLVTAQLAGADLGD